MTVGYSGSVRLDRQWSVLRSMRVRCGLTQQELADSVHASRRTISTLERGRSVPSLPLALAIARRLDIAVDELFEI